jgi:hypothetical protein
LGRLAPGFDRIKPEVLDESNGTRVVGRPRRFRYNEDQKKDTGHGRDPRDGLPELADGICVPPWGLGYRPDPGFHCRPDRIRGAGFVGLMDIVPGFFAPG